MAALEPQEMPASTLPPTRPPTEAAGGRLGLSSKDTSAPARYSVVSEKLTGDVVSPPPYADGGELRVEAAAEERPSWGWDAWRIAS